MGSPVPATPTVTPTLTQREFAERLIGLFPPGWASQQSRTPGGAVAAVMQTIGSQLSFELGAPLTQIATIGGTATAFDTLSLFFAGSNFQGSRQITHVVGIGELLGDIAQALAFGISSDPVLGAVGVRATVAGSVITVIYPNIPSGQLWTNKAPVPNVITIVASTSVGATETLVLSGGAATETGALQYAWAATRIQTAQDTALDLAAKDFFAGTLPRAGGEPDGAYRLRVLAALANLGQGATRQAVINALTALGVVAPRVVEPWSPGDTGVIDGVAGAGMMFLDVDTARTPGRVTDPSLAYQGFIDLSLTGFPILGGNALPCLDDGLYLDIAGSSTFDFLGAIAVTAQAVYDAINRTKVFGTVVWVRFVPAPGLNYILSDNGQILLDDNGNPLTWP